MERGTSAHCGSGGSSFHHPSGVTGGSAGGGLTQKAKLRGMRAAGVEARGFPIVRQWCGCRMFVELGATPDGDALVADLCQGHMGVTKVVPIGRLVAKEVA